MSLEELCDLRTPWCVHVVVTLRAAEHIESAIRELDALASAAKCDARVLGMVLRHLVSRGICVESAADQIALNALARELLEPGVRIGLDLDGIGGRMADVWGTLLTFVRTGEPGYAERFRVLSGRISMPMQRSARASTT